METQAHARLKELAIRFLREWGGRAVAAEVRCPMSRFRIDAAGYIDRHPRGAAARLSGRVNQRSRRREPAPAPRTVMLECKQSRADFLRDRRDLERLLRYRAKLDGVRRSIEEHHVQAEEPHLRREGSSLFPEMEDWDYASSRHRGYRRILRKLKRVDAQIHGGTKFCLMSRYRLADFFYLVAPQGLVRRAEIPPGWGLLECAPEWLEAAELPSLFHGPQMLHVAVPAVDHQAQEVVRQRLLRNIAVAASWQAMPDTIWRRDERAPHSERERRGTDDERTNRMDVECRPIRRVQRVEGATS